MSESWKVGLVTVTYNSGDVVDAFLKSVLRQSHANFRTYVVDNGSADDTLDRLAQVADPRITTIANAANAGFAAANNQAIRAALADGCDRVLLINNDTEFDGDFLAHLLCAMDERKTDMVVPKMMFFDDPRRIWCAGGRFLPARGYLTRQFGYRQIDAGQFDVPRDVQFAPMCCMLIHKRVFEKIGLLDDHYFVYCEDNDFCYRALRSGLRLTYIPTAAIYHKVSSLTGGEGSQFALDQCDKNLGYFLRKNLAAPVQAYSLGAFLFTLGVRLALRRDTMTAAIRRWRILRSGMQMAGACAKPRSAPASRHPVA